MPLAGIRRRGNGEVYLDNICHTESCGLQDWVISQGGYAASACNVY